MAEQTPSPQDLQKIREYLVSSGVKAAELRQEMERLERGGDLFALRLREANKFAEETKTTFEDLNSQIRNVINDLRGMDSTSRDINKSFRGIESIASKLKYDAQGITDLNKKDLISLERKLKIEISNLTTLRNQLRQKKEGDRTAQEISQLNEIESILQENGELRQDENNYLTKALNLIQERKKEEEKINKTLGLSGALVQGIVTSLGKLGISSEFFEGLKEDMQSAAKSGNMWKVASVGTVGILKGLKEFLKDPVAQITLIYNLFKSLVTSALDYQNRLFESAKALGLNVNETEKLVVNFRMMAASNSQMGLTSAEMVKYYGEMASALGIMVNENAEFMTQSTAITRNLGITAEQFQTVQLLAKESGKSVKDAFASIVGTAKAQGARLKIAMTERQVMEAVGKVSATVFNNFRGSVSQLTKAVVTATKFGTTLDQINQAGMQLLDFESSISKEFEAQLLTGKQMDLTMARQYALTGETDKLMKEITNQLGSQNAWNNMNVLKQQSLAESLGMSKEAVDEIFKKQALINALGPAASKNLEEQYKYLLEREGSHAKVVELMGQESAERALQASAQTQLNAAVAELKDSFAAIGNALFPITATIGALARGISKITQESKTMLNILKGMLSLYLGIKIVQIAINAQRAISLALIKAQRKQETKNTGLSIVGAMAGLIGKGGIPGLLIAGAVAAGLFALMSKYGEGGDSVGSMVTPPSLEGGEKQISPMNQATATAKANSANSDKVSGTPRVFVNITDNSKFDPVKPNQVRDFSYNIVSSDGVAGAMGR